MKIDAIKVFKWIVRIFTGIIPLLFYAFEQLIYPKVTGIIIPSGPTLTALGVSLAASGLLTFSETQDISFSWHTIFAMLSIVILFILYILWIWALLLSKGFLFGISFYVVGLLAYFLSLYKTIIYGH